MNRSVMIRSVANVVCFEWSVLKVNQPILIQPGNAVILTCFFIIYLRNAAKKWSASTLILVKLLVGSPVLNSDTT